MLTAAAVLALAAAGPLATAAPAPVDDHPFAPEPDSADNGVVMMVHGHVEPDPLAPTPAPPAHEALVATNEDGIVRLAVIPYSPDAEGTWRPNDLSAQDPELLVDAPGTDEVWQEPNVDAADHDRCAEETSLPGHEGPPSACLVFAFDAGTFDGRNAPALELHWDGGVEVYNAAAHALMHDRFEGGPVPVSQADGLTDQPTPFVVESLVDPVP